MPRIARALADNCHYHLINVGNGRHEVFHKDGDYRALVDLLPQTIEKKERIQHAKRIRRMQPI